MRRLVLVLVTTLATLGGSNAAAQQMVSFWLENRATSANTNQYVVEDRVCSGETRFNGSIQGGQKVRVSACADSTGKADVRIRNPDLNNDWVGFQFIRQNDTISR